MPVIHHGTTPETEMRSGIRGKFLADGRLGATGVASSTPQNPGPRCPRTCTAPRSR